MDELFWLLVLVVSLVISVFVGLGVLKKDMKKSWAEMVIWGALMHSIAMAIIVFALGVLASSIIAYFFNIHSLLSYF